MSSQEAHSVLENEQLLNDFWNSWFSVYSGLGREVFDGDRIFLNSPQAFRNYLAWARKTHNAAWVSVQPFSERNKVTSVEKLFFDFDCPTDLSQAWKEASYFVKVLRESYGVEALVCFSGAKGYHVYVWLSRTDKFSTGEEAKRFYKTAQKLILKGLNFKTIDPQVLGDIKRLARVPYSTHEKSLKLCVPVTQSCRPCLLFDLNLYKTHCLTPEFSKLCHEKTEKPQQHKTPIHSFNPESSNQDMRPCLTAALNQDLAQSQGHSIRIAIAAEYLKAGHSPEQTAELFKNQADYSFEQSLYYVRDIAARAYKPYKCVTIRELGFCLKNCPRKTRGENLHG